ncbi:MAG: hypothetical protein MUC62_04945 [Candidatus Thermoplasmatota archaeon]|jgi:hypothetical protein|nr:hypothetical protein [Candidatus Thermoplasmatota archaeon]
MLKRYFPAMMFLATALLLALWPQGADGAAVVVDASSVTYTPTSPFHTDTINVSARVVVSKAVLGEGSVVLKHSLCTDTYCALPETAIMVLDNSSGLYKVTIGPFQEKDASDLPYIDIRFHVEATGTATDGTSGPVKGSSKEITVYFKEDGPVDDDDDDGNESPFPLLALSPLVLFPLLRRARKRTH